MKKVIISTVSLLLCFIMSISAFAIGSFTDVEKGKWYCEAVEYVYENEVMIGVTNTEFGPNIPTNRAMVVTVLAKLANADLTDCTDTGFVDVKVDSWYGKKVIWAQKNGIVAGIDKTHFEPMTEITREQMCVMLSNFLDFMGLSTPNPKVEPFADIDKVSKWAVDAVERLQKADIVSGKDGNFFDPKGTATRAEIAQIILSSRLADIRPSQDAEQPGSSDSSSDSERNEQTEQTPAANVVYITPKGKRYHLDKECPGKNARETTLEEAQKAGLSPCDTCVE